jgi:hypothetical protein
LDFGHFTEPPSPPLLIEVPGLVEDYKEGRNLMTQEKTTVGNGTWTPANNGGADYAITENAIKQ